LTFLKKILKYRYDDLWLSRSAAITEANLVVNDPQTDCVSRDRSQGELEALRRLLAVRAGRLRSLSEHYSLLAGETRLKIIALLADCGELCVCDLASVLEMTPAAVSQHLSRLRSGRLVRSRRDGMTIYYRLTGPVDVATLDSIPGHNAAGEE
jgi:ArsR family transcriptional regulator, lead/cadmium/zinc/bismuth-responsive transcriptional repressor